jgi:hypothetical protein
LSRPHLVEKLVLGNHPIAMMKEIEKQVEDLGLQLDQLSAAAELI